MTRVHVALGLIVLGAFLVGYLEPRPSLEDFDPAEHAGFEDTWARRVHLAYWEKWGSFERDACRAMVDDFNRVQDDIFVHYLTTSQVDRKSMLAVIGGDPPDLVGLWDKDVPPFAEGGALLPLDELMRESGLSPDDYIPNYLALCRYGGGTYALPTAPSTVALFWNKELFRERGDALRAAGLDPERAPRTLDELDRYNAVLSEFHPDGSPKTIGFLPTEPGWFSYAWGYYFGGSLYDPRTDRITADAPANVEAYAWVKRIAERYGRERMLRFRSGFGNFDSPQNAFVDRKVAMIMQGVWFPNFIRRHRPHMEFGVVPFPCGEGVPGPRSVLEADVIGIPRGCKHPDEAWRFVHYVQTRGLGILCRLQGKHLPVRRTPRMFREGHPNLELEVFERLAASPHSYIMPRLIVWSEYRQEMEQAFEHIWGWPVPQGELAGLSGAAREEKMEALCRAEVARTLRGVSDRIQAKLDRKRELAARRRERDRP